MPSDIDQTQNSSTVSPCVITLPATVTITTVDALAMDLAKLQFNKGTAYTLDAALTETITTPGVQLILALAKTMQSIGATITIKNQNQNFTEAFHDLGLATQLAQLEGR